MHPAPGTQLGPYEILTPLGAGGMGEVWRARDPRLGRDVAVKVLPPDFARDEGRMRRFQVEARAVAALSHPNVLSVFDTGLHEGSPFLVLELLEGETLRERLEGGPLPMRKAVDIAAQVARGLSAAHGKGIVHRDLKPENIFLTTAGQAKILDFGLAKLVPAEGLATQDDGSTHPGPDRTPTETVAGVVLGSVRYMSPEHARAHDIDPRADIFALGIILYEALSGRRPFEGGSPVEVLSAILRDEPPPLTSPKGPVPPALARLVAHCLEKEPENRFQSARDLAYDLENLAESSTQDLLKLGPLEPGATARVQWRRAWPVLALGAAALLAAGWLGATALRRPAPSPVFERLTFRQGRIWGARFSPDGQTLLYGAAWGEAPVQVYSSRLGSAEFRPLGIPGSSILAVSRQDEMLLALESRLDPFNFWIKRGALARAPLAGGTPRPLLEDVQWADWSPDGSAMAVVRVEGHRHRLEYPQGQVLAESAGWISHPRLSPDGRHLAWIEHPVPGDDRGFLMVSDLQDRRPRPLGKEWGTIQGLAWRPDSREVWFSAGDGSLRTLHAADLAGRIRTVAAVPGVITLQDISREGRVLLTYDYLRSGILVLGERDTHARDMSQFNWSRSPSIQADGSAVAFEEAGISAGPNFEVYFRRTDGSPAFLLGLCVGPDLSPDGREVLGIQTEQGRPRLVRLPTGAGEVKPLDLEPFDTFHHAAWTGREGRILFSASRGGAPPGLHLHDPRTGRTTALTPEGSPHGGWGALDPAGRRLAARTGDTPCVIYALDRPGEAPSPVPGLEPGEQVIQWTADGQGLLVFRPGGLPLQVHRLDLATGKRAVWRDIPGSGHEGAWVNRIRMTPDGRSLALRYIQDRSDLYRVEGLR